MTKREIARVVWAMAMGMRVAVNKGSEEGKMMAMVTRVADKGTAAAMRRVMATKTREAGKEEGKSKNSKNNGNCEKDGNGK
jgi:hypothetical protein